MTNWHYIIRRCANGNFGWVAMAKREPFVTDGDFINEPGDLWFQFGMTRREAKARIEAETGELDLLQSDEL